jgi:metal-sulfur cluster biosynthetic enzyme
MIIQMINQQNRRALNTLLHINTTYIDFQYLPAADTQEATQDARDISRTQEQKRKLIG